MKISFMPSASVCRSPNGPALFGPTRFCMPAMTLRSNQTMNIVPTRPMTKMTSTLSTMMTSGVHFRPPSSSGSMASIRCAPPGRRWPPRVASMMSVSGGAGDVERHLQRAPWARRRRPTSGSTTAPRGAVMPDVGALGDAEAVEVERVDVRRARAGQRGQRRRVGRSDGPVVELAGQHQPVVVADPVGCARHRLGERRRVGGRHGEHAVPARAQGDPGDGGVRRHVPRRRRR